MLQFLSLQKQNNFDIIPIIKINHCFTLNLCSLTNPFPSSIGILILNAINWEKFERAGSALKHKIISKA